jgi:hypothetical protein
MACLEVVIAALRDYGPKVVDYSTLCKALPTLLSAAQLPPKAKAMV